MVCNSHLLNFYLYFSSCQSLTSLFHEVQRTELFVHMVMCWSKRGQQFLYVNFTLYNITFRITQFKSKKTSLESSIFAICLGKDCRNCPYWLPQLGGEYTPDAVQGGWNGITRNIFTHLHLIQPLNWSRIFLFAVEPLYVARIHVYGPYGFELLPGFFLPSRKSAFAGTQKNVYSNVHFALLVNCIAEWIEIDKDLPDDAIEGKQ